MTKTEAASGALRRQGAHRRPRHADFRYRQGSEWQGILYGKELLGKSGDYEVSGT